jgi:hypothetical protein
MWFIYWPGWSLVFGTLFVIQLIREWRARMMRSTHDTHLRATLEQLGLLRVMLTEAIDKGEVIKSNAEKQWVRQLAWSLVGVEGHLRAALGEAESVSTRAVQTTKE